MAGSSGLQNDAYKAERSYHFLFTVFHLILTKFLLRKYLFVLVGLPGRKVGGSAPPLLWSSLWKKHIIVLSVSHSYESAQLGIYLVLQ